MLVGNFSRISRTRIFNPILRERRVFIFFPDIDRVSMKKNIGRAAYQNQHSHAKKIFAIYKLNWFDLSAMENEYTTVLRSSFAYRFSDLVSYNSKGSTSLTQSYTAHHYTITAEIIGRVGGTPLSFSLSL